MKKSIKSENSIQGIENSKKIEIKKSEKLDSANLENLKKSESGKEEIRSGNIYSQEMKSLQGKSDKERRGKIRRNLEKLRNSILGKDRKEEERKNSLIEFLAFYKKYWRIQDFKFENFSNQKDADFKKDWENILNLAKMHLEGKKKK